MAQLQPGDPGFDWSQYESFRKGNDPLAEAQAFLADPARAQAPQPSEEDFADARELTTSPELPMSLRDFTDIGEVASLPLGIAGMVPTPASPFLLSASALLSGAGGLRKMINPEEDESRVGGAVQSAFAGVPALGAAMRGLKGIGGHAMKRFPYSAEKAYKTGSPTQMEGLNEAPSSIQGLMEKVGQALPDSATQNLPESWKQFASAASPAVAKRAPAAIKRTPKGMISKMNLESAAGYRTVPSDQSVSGPWEGGLDSLAPEQWRGLMLRRSEQYPLSKGVEAGSALVDDAAGYGEDLLAGLSANTKRLSIPARARAFRSNTALPE